MSSGGYSILENWIGVFRGGKKILPGIAVVSSFGLNVGDFSLMYPLEECGWGDVEEFTDLTGFEGLVFIHSKRKSSRR